MTDKYNTMTTPIWTIAPTNLGTIQHGVTFTKTILAIYASDYRVISGSMPTGAMLSSDGTISGICYEQNYNSNNPITTYTFTIRASSAEGEYVDKVFKMSLLSQQILIPSVIDQNSVKFLERSFSYQIARGTVNSANNVYWRLDKGILPDGVSLYQNGSIELQASTVVKPFVFNSFIKPGVTIVPDSVIESWNQWALRYLASIGPDDHQVVLSLRNNTDPIQLSVTARITFIRLSGEVEWFDENSDYAAVDSTMTYAYISVTDKDFITWNNGLELPSLNNGAISELSVSALSESGKKLTYSLRPYKKSFLPLGLFFLNNGLIAGRSGFRCHVDDPANLPVNDDYYFTVRAKTIDNFSFTEQTFKLHINRANDKPYVNLWIRSFPTAQNRKTLADVLGNKALFPESLMYRKNDPWFGRSKELRILFAPGLNPGTVQEFYDAMVNNHYTKELLFGEVKNAYAYDQNLNLVYEVVYLPIVDNLGKYNIVTNKVASLPDEVDLRKSLTNYYWKDGVPQFFLTPNGLENMRSQFESVIGYHNKGILPRWMLSPQPVPNKPGQYYPPTGYKAVVVLAYTIPKGSETILYRLKRSGINFNDFRFEFDRLELDDNLTSTYDSGSSSFLTDTETTFDSGLLTFEEGTTRFNRSSDFVGGQGPGGNKYLKFPRTGTFR